MFDEGRKEVAEKTIIIWEIATGKVNISRGTS